MTKRHTIDYYMDGYCVIPFCKVCSAEGDKLLDECQGPYRSGLVFFKNMTREEFEEKFGPIDQKKLDEMGSEIYIKAIR